MKLLDLCRILESHDVRRMVATVAVKIRDELIEEGDHPVTCGLDINQGICGEYADYLSTALDELGIPNEIQDTDHHVFVYVPSLGLYFDAVDVQGVPSIADLDSSKRHATLT